MRLISLTQGKFAQVDDEDFERLSQFKWHALKHRNRWYARRVTWDGEKQHGSYMHCDVMGVKGLDHRDNDGLNNQKSNLRRATDTQNKQSKRNRPEVCSSQFRGVDFDTVHKKWRARVCLHKKLIHLGRFHNEEDAARAYDTAARLHFGEFAAPNFT